MTMFGGRRRECPVCGRFSAELSATLGGCPECVRQGTGLVLDHSRAAHSSSRQSFGLPATPPRGGTAVCDRCVNACAPQEGRPAYCGTRRMSRGRIVGGDELATVSWYHDPLPTNCVADWVCPGGTGAGFPIYARARGPERGFTNLAVFYESCTFDCLFCQNWHFRERCLASGRVRPEVLVEAVDASTACICYFGGDPTPHLEHALRVSRLARSRSQDQILRICFETNGSMSLELLDEMIDLGLESGGCIKFDLKALDPALHRILTGAENRWTLRNFEHLTKRAAERPDPPLAIASTLLVPGYIDEGEVEQIARFIAALDPETPYALLAFAPQYLLSDLRTTSRAQADRCHQAAKEAGLKRVRVGNRHLLR